MTERPLPRLLYLGDVPVESSYHGSALLYRLLEDYPAERLLALEAGRWVSQPERRVRGVRYENFPIPGARLLSSRLAGWYGPLALRGMEWLRSRVRGLAADFRPEAVLTVTQGYSWLAAAAYAEAERLPLHLILHDDWMLCIDYMVGFAAAGRIKPWADRTMGRYYRLAQSRLCVSPAMRDHYRESYGADGDVLYPSRARDCPAADAPAPHLLHGSNGSGPVFGYAGSVNYIGYARAMIDLAEILAARGGKLIYYGPLRPERAAEFGLAGRPDIELRGLCKSEELIGRLREEADAIYVPMSFAPEDRPNMEISFPSKLTDCTAVGLPLLIHGPAYCSASRWARENPDVAELVETEDRAALAAAAHRLIDDPARRVRLAGRALEMGQEYFSHAAAARTFSAALRAGANGQPRAPGNGGQSDAKTAVARP